MAEVELREALQHASLLDENSHEQSQFLGGEKGAFIYALSTQEKREAEHAAKVAGTQQRY